VPQSQSKYTENKPYKNKKGKGGKHFVNLFGKLWLQLESLFMPWQPINMRREMFAENTHKYTNTHTHRSTRLTHTVAKESLVKTIAYFAASTRICSEIRKIKLRKG